MKSLSDNHPKANSAAIMRLTFVIILTVLFFLFIIGFAFDYSGVQANVFFSKTQDYMADYYNVAKASHNLDPYLFGQNETNPERAYFPFTYLLFSPLSNLANYENLSAFQAGRSSIGLATSAFYMLITTAPFLLLLYEASVIRDKRMRFWIISCIALSGVMIFAYERGTTMILAALLSSFFLLNYKNENRVTREIAFLALAIAAALKGIPAMLGILLVYEKRWMEALRLIAYGVIFIAVPFLFVKGGFQNIPQFILNLQANSAEYAAKPYRGLNYRFWMKELHLLSTSFLGTLWRRGLLLVHYAMVALALLSALFQKNRWKKLSLLMFAVALFSKNNGDYWALFLLPGIVLFLNEETQPPVNFLYILGFILILNPFQIVDASGLNWTSALRNLSCMACFFALTMDSVLSMIRVYLDRRRGKIHPTTEKSC